MRPFLQKITILVFLFLCAFQFSGFSKQAGSDSSRLKIGIQKMYAENYARSNPDSSLYYAKEMYEQAGLLGDTGLMVDACMVFGDAYFAGSNFYAAASKYVEGLAFFKEGDQSDEKARLLLRLGKAYTVTFNTTEAITNLYEALKLFEKQKDVEGKVETLVAIGEYFRKIERYVIAENNLMKAKELLSDSMAKSEIGIKLYNRLAAVKSEIGLHKESLVYSYKALELARLLKNVHLQAISLNEIGFVYEKEHASKAVKYYEKASFLWAKIGYSRYRANALINLSRYSIVKQDYRKASLYLDTLETISTDKNWFSVEKDLFSLRSDLYKHTGDYKKAYEYQYLQFNRQYEILKREKDERIEGIISRAELKEKEWLIEKQQKQLELERAENNQKEKEKLWLLVTGILFSFLTVMLAYAYFTLRGERKKLNSMNAQLQKALEYKDMLVREIHHRVKNNLNMLSGLVYLQKESVEDEQAKEVLEDCQSRIDTISFVHKQLSGSIANPTVKLGPFLNSFINNIVGAIGKRHIKISSEIECYELELRLKKAVPLALIINELFTNSLKHGYKGQPDFEIGLSIKLVGGKLEIRVFDNGPGIQDVSIIDEPVTLGIKLVFMLGNQLMANIFYSKNEFSEFYIKFKPD